MYVRSRCLALVTATVLLAGGCAPREDRTASTDERVVSCKPADLNLVTDGKLTVGTDAPAYEPWFAEDDPASGEGFESAVAYAIADELGFERADVTWTEVPFNSSYQPGAKKFDFDINQISITAARKRAVTFSKPYYKAAQAIIVKADGKFAEAASLKELAAARIGVQVGTTSLQAVEQVTSDKPRVYDDTNQATNALKVGQVDALVADLPSAYYITAAVLKDAKIVGQFQPETGQQEAFGLLLEKGNPLVRCLDKAIDALGSAGTLTQLEDEWLSDSTGVPELR